MWISGINTICLECTIVSREVIYGGQTLLQHLCFLCVRSNKAERMEAKDKGGQQPDRWDSLNLTEGETSKDIWRKLCVTTVMIHLEVINWHRIQAPLLSPSLSSFPPPSPNIVANSFYDFLLVFNTFPPAKMAGNIEGSFCFILIMEQIWASYWSTVIIYDTADLHATNSCSRNLMLTCVALIYWSLYISGVRCSCGREVFNVFFPVRKESLRVLSSPHCNFHCIWHHWVKSPGVSDCYSCYPGEPVWNWFSVPFC